MGRESDGPRPYINYSASRARARDVSYLRASDGARQLGGERVDATGSIYPPRAFPLAGGDWTPSLGGRGALVAATGTAGSYIFGEQLVLITGPREGVVE